jgi:hypothetical protein
MTDMSALLECIPFAATTCIIVAPLPRDACIIVEVPADIIANASGGAHVRCALEG